MKVVKKLPCFMRIKTRSDTTASAKAGLLGSEMKLITLNTSVS
jgi:hypothetical protein